MKMRRYNREKLGDMNLVMRGGKSAQPFIRLGMGKYRGRESGSRQTAPTSLTPFPCRIWKNRDRVRRIFSVRAHH